jgi:hypothetical protein
MKHLVSVDEFMEEILALPDSVFAFTPEERAVLVEQSAEQILRHYGVEARRGSDLLQ